MIEDTLRIHKMGESNWLLQWKYTPSQELLYYLLAVKKKLSALYDVEIVHTYTELLIKDVRHTLDVVDVEVRFREIVNSITTVPIKTSTLFRIPVCYDPEFGNDIIEVSNTKKCTISEIISRHTEPIYTIYFMGFLPGFPYLEGLDQRLSIERKSTPRQSVPKGSVAIGGNQTGIYPQKSPGGWHVIGNSPISFFNPTSKPPTPFKAGDVIQFYAIDKQTHIAMKAAFATGSMHIESYQYDR